MGSDPIGKKLSANGKDYPGDRKTGSLDFDRSGVSGVCVPERFIRILVQVD